MKRLIVTIIAAILTISLTGCSFVREYHRAPVAHEVIVTAPPRHILVRHHRWHHPRPNPRYHYERRHHPVYRHRPH